MLKRLIAKWCGLESELNTLRQRVEELSWDSAYGMWTRSAVLQFCQVLPRSRRTIVFIDLDAIHLLNRELGYTAVDARIQASFSAISLRASDLVARWYSGDEIVILFDSDRPFADSKIAELQASAETQGLTFKYAVGDWEVGKESIEDVVKELSDRIAMRKPQRRSLSDQHL